ncbi:hypothetical protein Tco_1039338 [Tanacetum coccineum]
MSTLVFVDPESSTQADGAQISRVPVPLPKDPYEVIRQVYLDGTDTESKPFEDPIDTETPETARMDVRIPHAMSLGLSAGMAEVAAMSESTFRKRFWSSYESSPSVSPPDLPSRKHYHGTSELVEDSEEDDDEEDEEIEESMDSDNVSEDTKDEGPTLEDENRAAEDKGLTPGVEGPDMNDKGYGLDDESHGIDEEGHSVDSDGLGLEEEEEVVPRDTTFTRVDIWFISISPSPSDDPSPISSPMIPLTVPSLIATPAAVKTEGFLTELEVQVQMQGGLISDHAVQLEELLPALLKRYDEGIGELFTRLGAVREEIFSQRYRFRSLEYEQERVAVTFRAIWRPVLALEAWAGQTDAQRAALWHAISDVQGENRDLRLQLAEERRARLELVEVVDGMRRGQEPRGGA